MGKKKKAEKKLRPRADGRYCAWYGSKGFYAQTPEEAIAKRDAYKKLALTGQLPDKTILRLYVAKWIKIAKTDVAPRTLAQYKSLLGHLLDALGDKKISEILPSDCQEVLAEIAGMSKSYISKSNFLFTEVFKSAMRDRIISVNPMDGLSVPKGTEGTHRAILDLERELIHKTGHRCRLAAMIMLYEGLRRGEVLALRADHILIDDGAIYVETSVQFWEGEAKEHGCKNAFSIRRVPIMEPIKEDLDAFVACSADDQLVFPAADGHSMCSETAFSRAWESYMVALSEKLNGDSKRWFGRRAGDTRDPADWKDVNIRCHDLRHTFVSDARDAGVDINVLRRWCGHSSTRMIMEIYDHVRPEREKSETDTFNQHFRSKTGAFFSQGKTDTPQTLTDQHSEPPEGFPTNQKVVGSNPAGLTNESLEE